MPDFASQQVIEFGGAGSYYLLAIAKWRGAQATAVDYSEPGIRLTQQIFAANDVPVETVCADIFDWRPRQKFDAVLHWGLIEHFADPSEVLRRCAEVLRPNGLVVFNMPNLDAWGSALWRRWSPRNWSEHVNHSDETLADACARAGLRLDRIYFYGSPLLQIGPWEQRGAAQLAATAIQRGLNLAGSPIYHRGHRRVSRYRGFVARPV